MNNRWFKWIFLIIVTGGYQSKAQDSANCFLNDFTPKDAVIPPYIDYMRTTAIPTVNISIDYTDTLNRVSSYIFGNAIAVWVSPDINNPTVVNQLQKLEPTLIRFPGGSWSDTYFWNGNPGDIPLYVPDEYGVMEPLYPQYGPNLATSLNRYLDLRNQIDAQGLITINYAYARYGLSEKPAEQAAHLAAEWVREDNGRTKFWELGNESAGPWEAGWRIDTTTNQDDQPMIISGTLYGRHFNIFADSMRKAAAEVGTQIYIGAQIIQYDGTNSWNEVDRDWNESVYREVADTADFYVIHNYFGGGDNSPSSYLNTALNSIDDMHEFINDDIQEKGAPWRPIALTEWNISNEGLVRSSFINGMQGVIAMGEMARLGYGLSCRWLLANWDTDGMFYHGGNSAIPAWNPRPDFFYLYYLQKYIGSQFLGSEISGSDDILCFSTRFNSGEIGVVIVNKGAADEAVEIELHNTGYGNRMYFYSLEGGRDNPPYSQNVFVNDTGPEPTRWGPLENIATLPSRSDTLAYPIRINSPALSVQYILIEAGDSMFVQVDADSIKVDPEDGILITEDNGTAQLVATIFPWNTTDNSVIWTTSDSDVVTIDMYGELKAIYNGSAFVSATTVDGNFSDTIEVNVTNQRYEVTGISVTTETGLRYINTPGGTLQMVAVIVPDNAEDKSVTWSVSDTAKAEIDLNGLLTAKRNDILRVTATTNDGGYTDDITINITGQPSALGDFSLEALKIYPVPAQQVLYIENNNPVLYFEILNIEGKVLKAGSCTGLKSEIDITGLAPGIYMLRVQSKTDSRIIRFVK